MYLYGSAIPNELTTHYLNVGNLTIYSNFPQTDVVGKVPTEDITSGKVDFRVYREYLRGSYPYLSIPLILMTAIISMVSIPLRR